MEALEDRRLLSGTSVTAGVILQEQKGVQFTANLGNLLTIAPGNNLKATIQWGDGTQSTGTLKSDGVIGLDELNFELDGTHTYKSAGTFTIHATVFRGTSATASSASIVASFTDSAVVSRGNISLAGAVTGRYSLAPVAYGFGATYVFNGTGHAGALGAVSAQGIVSLPTLNATGDATGSLTLTKVSTASALAGSVTLLLTGPSQSGGGPFPSTLSYTIESGTGVYAGFAGSGTIAVIIGGHGGNNGFTFTFM